MCLSRPKTRTKRAIKRSEFLKTRKNKLKKTAHLRVWREGCSKLATVFLRLFFS